MPPFWPGDVKMAQGDVKLITWGAEIIHYFSKNPSRLADVAWMPKHRFFSVLNIIQRPQHRFLAKLWHKNDVFDEKGVWGS